MPKTYNSILICLLMLFGAQVSRSQSIHEDLALLSSHTPKSELPDHSYAKHADKKIKVINAINPVYWVYKGGLAFYQRHISSQLSTSCIYETSCSRFGKQLFDEFGPFKGLFLSIDRVSRCNRLTYSQVSPLRLNSQGRIIESTSDYSNN